MDNNQLSQLASDLEGTQFEPEWHKFDVTVENETRQPEFLIKYLDTLERDRIYNKSLRNVAAKKGRGATRELDNRKWRQNIINESLKGWRNLLVRDTIAIAIDPRGGASLAKYKELVSKYPVLAEESLPQKDGAEGAAAALIDRQLSAMMRNPEFSAFVTNLALSKTDEMGETEEEEKKI